MSASQYLWLYFADEKDGGELLSATPILLHNGKVGPKGRFQGITFNGKFRGDTKETKEPWRMC